MRITIAAFRDVANDRAQLVLIFACFTFRRSAILRQSFEDEFHCGCHGRDLPFAVYTVQISVCHNASEKPKAGFDACSTRQRWSYWWLTRGQDNARSLAV